MALDGGDPRLSTAGVGVHSYQGSAIRKMHDSSVTFEEYLYYAEETRARETPGGRHGVGMSILPARFAKKGVDNGDISPSPDKNEKSLEDEKGNAAPAYDNHIGIADEEWFVASRAARTATWGAVFYLITTDILGPFSVPWAFGTTGYGPGITLYTVFGALAGYSGWQLWRMFLRLDSDQYPLKTYGDIAFRVYGTWARHSLNFLQTVQLLCNVGVIVIQNGQSLSQVSNFKLCYAICCLVWAIAGMLVGQVRTLQKYGFIANFAIWLNVLIIFITMGVAAHSLPNYDAIAGAAGTVAELTPLVTQNPDGSWPPVTRSGGLPNPGYFSGAVLGLMQAVYSYGGAMLFCEFMSEMKRPWDFWKGMVCAQSFIYVCYMLYGLFIYSYQGQYTYNPAYQGIAPYNWQTAGNVLGIVSALIAAGLYGNIGVKVLYNNILVDVFKAPPLTTRTGKLLWAGIIPIYWAIAFILAASIPNFSALTGIVAAVCILQFTYSFPPFLMLGFEIKQHAMQPGEGFDPATGQVTRHDSGIKRWVRGFMAKYWYVKVFNVLYFLGALVTAGLGSYSAIEALIAQFAAGKINAFSCHSPLDASS